VLELPENNIISIVVVLRKRSPIMVEDSVRAYSLVKYYYPEARNISIITLNELKDKIKNDQCVAMLLRENTVFLYAKDEELKKIIKELSQPSNE